MGAMGADERLSPPVPRWLSELFEKISLPGAPLRNRTVDLLLTMQADTVWRRRIGSDYRSSEGCQRLGKSSCICGNLEPLSLD